MIRVYRSSGFPLLWTLLLLPLIFIIGLPLLILFVSLASIGLFIGMRKLKKIKRAASAEESWVSNKNIGEYYIKRDAQDPNVIEVVAHKVTEKEVS